MVTSFEQLLDQIAGGGARGASRAEPWRQHQTNRAGGRQFGVNMRPAGMSSPPPRRSGGRGLSSNQLERLIDPRTTRGMQMARSQLQTAEQQAIAAGVSPEEQEADPGILNAAFRALDLPRATAFNAVRAVVDPNMGFDDFTKAVHEREGFGETTGLVVSEDDSGIERVLKGAGAFVGDVATDPLNLVTFGATTVGKKLGTKAIQGAVAGRAPTYFSRKTIEGFANQSVAREAIEKATQRGLSDDSIAALTEASNSLNSLELGRNMIGSQAAAAFQRRGATGLREFLEDLGPEGQQLWDSLPTDIKGGLRIRVPFSREEGVRKAFLVAGGGGRLSQSMGLNRAVDAAHAIRGRVRASKAAQGFHRSFGGANGDLYGEMAADIVNTNSDKLGGQVYEIFRIVDEGQRAARIAKRTVLTTGERTVGRISNRLNHAGTPEDVETAQKAYHQFVHDPERMNTFIRASSGVEQSEDGSYFLSVDGEDLRLSRGEFVGLQSAREFHDTLRNLYYQAVDAGVNIDLLNDYYIPRYLSEAKREHFSANRVKGPGLKMGSGPYVPPRARKQFAELTADFDPETGLVNTRVRHLSPERINQVNREREALRMKYDGVKDPEDQYVEDFFAEDPQYLLAQYANAMGNIVADAQFAKMIRHSGSVLPGDLERPSLIFTRDLAEAGDKVNAARNALHRVAEEGGDMQETLHELVSDFDALRGTIQKVVNDEPTEAMARLLGEDVVDNSLTPRQQVKMVDIIMKQMDRHIKTIPSAKKAGKEMTTARNEFRRAMAKARDAKTVDAQPGEVSRVFNMFYPEQAEGFEGTAGRRIGAERTVSSPERAPEVLNPEEVRKVAFDELATAQRAEPERVMLEAQRELGGGELSTLLEHVGDLTNRMAKSFGPGNFGHGDVGSKLRLALRSLRSNASRDTMGKEARRAPDALDRYAQAHAALPVHNEAQRRAREAAVALGRRDFFMAERHLQYLDDLHKDPDAWRRAAGEFDADEALRQGISVPEAQVSEVSDDAREASEELGLRLTGVGVEPGEQRIRRLPPEVDLTYMPENMRLAVNKFYKMADPKEANSVVNKHFRPFLTMFKVQATIGRGVGFHIRNAIGGMFNNDLIGVTLEHNRLAARLVRERVNAAQAAKQKVVKEGLAKGASRREVMHSPGFTQAVSDEVENILQQRLGKVQATKDMTLYDVHQDMIKYEIDWRQNPYQELGEATDSGFVPVGFGARPPGGPLAQKVSQTRAAEVMSKITGRDFTSPENLRIMAGARRQADLYPGTPVEDMSKLQVAAESMANLWWVRFNAGLAEMTESYLRGAAFIKGLDEYGDPRVARFLPLATQFDYNDLSSVERRWLRGSLVPFYTWIRNNIPLQVRAAFQQPGKMNRLNLLLDNAEEAFGDDDVDLVPEWMRDRFMFVSRFKFDGNPQAFGLEHPAQDLNEWFKVGHPLSVTAEFAKNLASASNPLFSIPTQLGSGTEIFTGAPLDETRGKVAPKWYEMLPDTIAPTWVDESTGQVMGDARMITSAQGLSPWLNESDTVLSVMGLHEAAPYQNRQVSDAIRLLFPVVNSGVVTPQTEAGEMFSRADRLRAHVQRNVSAEDAQMIQQLKDAGYEMETIAHIMQNVRARRNATG